MNKGKNMKKTLTMALGLAVIASAAFAEPTYSKNAVGFINIEAEANELYSLTVPFDNLGADDGLWDFESTQLANDAPVGSTVYIWAGTSWREYNKGKKGFGIEPEYAKLTPGQCFFFQPSDNMVITMAGQVPDTANTFVSVAGSRNLSAIGNPYPTPLDFESSTLATDPNLAKAGSTVYIWDGKTWKEYNKGKKGFGIDPEYATIQPGVGFFFQTTDDTESGRWEVEKGYTWP
jgi:hypothetical protein